MKRPEDARLRSAPQLSRSRTVTSAPSHSDRVRPARKGSDSPAREAKDSLRRARRARKASERDDIRRFTAHVRRRRRAVLVSVGALVALGTFVAVGTFTPVMALTTVTVLGAERVDASLISEGVASQLGRPLPLVDAALIEAVIARQPLVESFAIESKPPHELVIRLTERQPVGYLVRGDRFVMVDPAGVTIATVESRDLDLPLFDVAGNSATAAGFVAGVKVIQALPADLRTQVSRVAASTTDDVTLFLKPTDSRVIWGSPEDSPLKSRVLQGLIATYPLGSVSQYDVSAPGIAIVS